MASIVTLDLLRGLQGVIVLLGIVIAYFATKSYKRTKSKSMLFMALGFVFVTIGAVSAGLLFELLNYDLQTVEAVSAAAEVVGFLLIIYSIIGARD